MKRISPEKAPSLVNFSNLRTLVSTSLLFSMVSCSSLDLGRRSLFGEGDVVDTEKKKKEAKTTVSKAQYDQLAKKYEILLGELKKKNESINVDVAIPASPFGGKNPADLVSELSQVKSKGELVETVDVFGKGGIANTKRPLKAQKSLVPESSGSDIESEISRLRKAQTLISQNRLDQALTILKELENSQVKQVRVRSKYYLGELLFVQGEYDLAMQIFEEIIQKDAFSGVVINALGRLIVCSEKLKLQKKKEKYYSILHDFFES